MGLLSVVGQSSQSFLVLFASLKTRFCSFRLLGLPKTKISTLHPLFDATSVTRKIYKEAASQVTKKSEINNHCVKLFIQITNMKSLICIILIGRSQEVKIEERFRAIRTQCSGEKASQKVEDFCGKE